MSEWGKNSLAWAYREPLVHFLGAGLVLFLLYLAFGPDEKNDPDRIHITAAQQRNIAALFERTWGRPPTAEEQEGLIAARIREEILSREAIAAGLSDGDAVIRQRLAQKLEFLSDDLAARLTPKNEDLEAFLKANSDRYQTDRMTDFRQVFVDRAQDGSEHTNRIEEVRDALATSVDPETLGDRTLLPRQLENATDAQIANVFGAELAASIGQMRMGEWQGPIASSFGHHFVFVIDRIEPRMPAVPEIRDTLIRDWRDSERLKLREAYYEQVRSRYRVDVEKTNPDAR